MTVYRLGPEPVFPPTSEAGPSGLLAVGGDLAPERLLQAYARGIFPWYEEPPILWFSPAPRAALVPRDLHLPRRLARTLRQGRFVLSLDRAFEEVVRACAGVGRRGQRGTWITDAMREAYGRLHELGFAHSCEAWRDGRLVGGLYGVSLGGAFFGESMFHVERDASKAALVTLVRQLDAWGFTLFDGQLPTPHLARFGFTPWPRARFEAALARALEAPTRRGRWRLGISAAPGEAGGA
ncbi:MAG: leucyl/phenylalanyl-tRNA--protein transferase [Myxococcota bacterium]|nr:leucyl/phenylalanyl-tRNA--protein transferase [Myxococcota bacterium]